MRFVSVLLVFACVSASAAWRDPTEEERARVQLMEEGKDFTNPDLALLCSGDMHFEPSEKLGNIPLSFWGVEPSPDFSVLINFKGDHGYAQVHRLVGELTRYPDEYVIILPEPGHPLSPSKALFGTFTISRFTGKAAITLTFEAGDPRCPANHCTAFEGTCKKVDALF